MPHYSPAARERAMKLQDVLLKAMAGEMSWIEAADVLGLSARTMRRWRYKFRCHGLDGLQDRRRRSPSHRAVPEVELSRWRTLYRRRYRGYNARHFYSLLRRRHGCRRSYSLVLPALQGAGLVGDDRAACGHYPRRTAAIALYRSRRLGGSHPSQGRACRQDSTDPGRSCAQTAGDRAHPRLLTSGPRAQRTHQSHPPGTPGPGTPEPEHPHPGACQPLPREPVPAGLQ